MSGPGATSGTQQVQISLTQQWLFNLQNMVATLIVEPGLLERQAWPLSLSLMKAGVARLEALMEKEKEQENGQTQ